MCSSCGGDLDDSFSSSQSSHVAQLLYLAFTCASVLPLPSEKHSNGNGHSTWLLGPCFLEQHCGFKQANSSKLQPHLYRSRLRSRRALLKAARNECRHPQPKTIPARLLAIIVLSFTASKRTLEAYTICRNRKQCPSFHKSSYRAHKTTC
jgi:hypothetical protein